MLKFDNTHIFTGYLKQLLSTTNLPTCKIYTKEFADHASHYGTEDPRVIESFDTIAYYLDADRKIAKKRIAHRTNYLKGNSLLNYFWPYSENGDTLDRKNNYWGPANSGVFYDKTSNTYGLTRTLSSSGNTYDTTTHEYLGDYLRFLRDYYDINLMSMYNCFNNKICNNIYYRVNRVVNGTPVTSVFDSRDLRYHIYTFPVKLFADYTIAIDCDQPIEMFCGFYNSAISSNIEATAKATDLTTKTYKRVTRSFFKKPFLYDKLNVKYWTFDHGTAKDASGYPKLFSGTTATRWDIASREQDLKLFIKVPASCKSSITVLEGNYIGFNDFKYSPKQDIRDAKSATQASFSGNQRAVWEYKRNHAILNFADKATLDKAGFRPIGKLQLLAANTGESYPFADRLIEFLSNSAITPIDEIADNIRRAQKVMAGNGHYFKIDGVWENKIQRIIYDYLINAGPVELARSDTNKKLVDKRTGYHRTLGHTSKSLLFDITGYIDKDAEKWYASWVKRKDEDKPVINDTIQNVNIYKWLDTI